MSVIVIGTIARFSALNALESIFAPLTDFWENRGFPSVIGALIGLTMTLLILTGLAMVFYPLAAQLIDQAPKVWSDMQDTIRMFQSVLGDLSKMGDSVTAAVSNAPATAPAATDGVALPSITDAQFVTPTLVGRNMAVNPLLVFLALVFGNWLWEPIGGIVAIPFLIWVLVLNGALTAPKPSE